MAGMPRAKKYTGLSVMALICFILGFGLTVQLKSVSKNNSEVQNTDMARADQIQKLLNNEKDKNDALQKQLGSYKKSLDDFRQQSAKTGNITKALNDRLNNTEILAGITAVEGPGITVTMDDSSASTSSGQNPSDFVIHDVDILQVLNELRDAGAEAISLNGERILSTTEVRCAGNTVSINNNRYAAPFVIKAIGKPDELKSALLIRNGIVDVLSQWGIEVQVETGNDLVINGYNATPQFKYAKPAGKGATK